MMRIQKLKSMESSNSPFTCTTSPNVPTVATQPPLVLQQVVHKLLWTGEKCLTFQISGYWECNQHRTAAAVSAMCVRTGTYLPLHTTVRVFKIDAAIQNAFPKCVCGATPLQTGRLLPKIGRLLLRIRKFFSEESEGFFRRALVSYTHKFPKCGAALLTDLPRLRLDLPRSRLGLPRLHLSRNSGPATEGFSNRGINFKDAYRT